MATSEAPILPGSTITVRDRSIYNGYTGFVQQISAVIVQRCCSKGQLGQVGDYADQGPATSLSVIALRHRWRKPLKAIVQETKTPAGRLYNVLVFRGDFAERSGAVNGSESINRFCGKK